MGPAERVHFSHNFAVPKLRGDVVCDRYCLGGRICVHEGIKAPVAIVVTRQRSWTYGESTNQPQPAECKAL
jgi:hypothetical protein